MPWPKGIQDILANEKVQQRLGIWNETFIAERLVDGPLTHILGVN